VNISHRHLISPVTSYVECLQLMNQSVSLRLLNVYNTGMRTHSIRQLLKAYEKNKKIRLVHAGPGAFVLQAIIHISAPVSHSSSCLCHTIDDVSPSHLKPCRINMKQLDWMLAVCC
jgi:hypothetical protein